LILFYAKIIILEIAGLLPEFVPISGTIRDRPVYRWEKIKRSSPGAESIIPAPLNYAESSLSKMDI
jgi:hypothetical protein